MSRSLSNATLTADMLDRLTNLFMQGNTANYWQAREDAESLRRISMTLHRWHELECGSDNGAIERDETTGKPYWRPTNGDSEFQKSRWPTPDREAGARKRLAAIMARYPSLASYVQGDPRGCALYILRPGDVPAGESPDAHYSRGLAVHQ